MISSAKTMCIQITLLSLVVTAVFANNSGHHETPGTCMCTSASGVEARTQAGTTHAVVATLSSESCYTFNGGFLTIGGHTWYEIQNVNGRNAWVPGNDIYDAHSSRCSSKRRRSFHAGLVSNTCLQCICDQESRCRAIGCNMDVRSLSCGYFQIKEAYYEDCGQPGSSWKSCADDLSCASQCVQTYMQRYIGRSRCISNCESFARIHNGGPHGCNKSSTISYWSNIVSIQHCSDNS